jgi:hypothetical protein
MQRTATLVSFSLVLLVLAAAPPTLAQSRLDFGDLNLASVARDLEMGDGLRIEGAPLGDAKAGSALVLERVRVFSPDARIVVHGADGERVFPAPKNVYLRGYVEGEPRSLAFLSVLEDGETRGLVAATGGRYWNLASSPLEDGHGPLTAYAIDAQTGYAEKIAGFECLVDDFGAGGEPFDLAPSAVLDLPPPAEKRGLTYTARIAFETDFEYYQKFGNMTDATNYIGDLIGFMSGIYFADVDTTLYVSSVSLWSTAADPWDEGGGASSTTCALYEFGKYWNDNNTGIERTIAHFLSGKSTNAGVAWVGVLCRGGSTQTVNVSGCSTLTNSTDNYVGGYGVTSGIDANFNPASPAKLWDIIGTSHEIGHNFNSPHTHCWMAQAGGITNVDQCYGSQTGCYSGSTSLPSGCPGSGQGCGLIMSYCHLLGGGLGNIDFTFGEGHPYGNDPDRVAARMTSHVVSNALSNPGCLDDIGTIFDDGFEIGTTLGWDDTIFTP